MLFIAIKYRLYIKGILAHISLMREKNLRRTLAKINFLVSLIIPF